MSNRRLKTTPFFRLLLALIIIAPLSYIEVSYINGEDGGQNIKKIFGIEPSVPTTDHR